MLAPLGLLLTIPFGSHHVIVNGLNAKGKTTFLILFFSYRPGVDNVWLYRNASIDLEVPSVLYI